MPKPDAAHLQTDKELAKLEKRIAKIYKEAADDLQKTIDDYFAKFAKRDAKQRALLEAGEITEQEYKQWRLAQMGRGERFKALQSRVAERYTEANKTAVRYVNDATPGIYSLNRNYSAYTIEKAAGNVGFDLWDEQTVKRLIVDNPEVMPYYPPEKALNRGIDLAYGKRQISASVTSSILQGKSIPGIAKDLQTRMPEMNKSSAVRTARTAVTGAQNAGRMDSYVAAEKMGIKVRKEWLATIDGRTRHSHAMLDGKVVDKDKKFGNGCMFPGDPNGPPWEVYNCRCTLIAAVDGVDTSNEQRRVRNPETGKNELVSDMTYQEWAGWKEKAQVQKAMDGEGTALNGDKYAMNPKDINGVTRGEAMSFEDADGQSGNPKYRKGTGTAQNCQSCVVANEARRRGYNVSAQSYTKNKTAEMLSKNPRIAWVDPKTGDVPDFVPWDYKRTYDKKSYRAFLEENVNAGERYTLQFNWGNASGGHIISAERDSRGALRLYDPQTGKIYEKDWSIDDLMGRMSYTDKSGRSDPPKLLRVDNLAFREDIAKDILEEGAKVWTQTDDPDDWIPF